MLFVSFKTLLSSLLFIFFIYVSNTGFAQKDLLIISLLLIHQEVRIKDVKYINS
jgi:hypothetical protein